MNDPAPITTDYHEGLRYDYPLTSDSLVLDCGGYEGNFARLIAERYKCKVVVFEPVKGFFKKCFFEMALSSKFHPDSDVINAGVGARERDLDFHIHGAMSGSIVSDPADDIERVHIIRLADWIGNQRVDLLKLNIEGMEYEVLADLLSEGKIKQITHIQVQFHKRTESDDQLHAVMRNELLRTHRITYDFPWVWSNYTLRT